MCAFRISAPPKDFRRSLESKARSLGFQLFGVAPATRLTEDLERLVRWHKRGDSAGMVYLGSHPEMRVDPSLIQAGAQSVVMLGMAYGQEMPDVSEESGEKEGRVARFALGTDYHQVVRPKLNELAHWIQQETGSLVLSKCFVDTGSLMERAFARAAGLGFIGKNNCLIHPTYGSYFILGGMVTTCPLLTDRPLACQCGDCRLCLDACPGGALCEPFRCDARRCLSYHTIETHDVVDKNMTERLGDRLFGCDVCQEVCPFNRKYLACQELELKPQYVPGRIDGANATLENILRIESNEEFERLFKGSGMTRARRRGLVRNAAIVAGHLQRRDLEGILKHVGATETNSDPIREAAKWALKKL